MALVVISCTTTRNWSLADREEIESLRKGIWMILIRLTGHVLDLMDPGGPPNVLYTHDPHLTTSTGRRMDLTYVAIECIPGRRLVSGSVHLGATFKQT